MRYLLRGGFPHSEIAGSKLVCQLADAYRRLPRLSSPSTAKASTMCAYLLDHITPSCLLRLSKSSNDYLLLFYCFVPLKYKTLSRLYLASIYFVSFIFLKNKPQYPLEPVGIEPTTPCLQSRCS